MRGQTLGKLKVKFTELSECILVKEDFVMKMLSSLREKMNDIFCYLYYKKGFIRIE